jgi:subtilase family serine protease
MAFPAIPLLLIACCVAGNVLQAQTVDRITQDVDSLKVQVLANHLPHWANAGNDVGVAPPNQMMDGLTMVLARSPEQELALQQLLADQQNPASLEFHRWLTPAEMGERFGLSEHDIATMTRWLRSQGLHVNWVTPSKTFIGFSGTAAEVGQAFQTEVHRFKVNGVERLSVSSAPLAPEALAPAIKAIQGLYTIDDRPLLQLTPAQTAFPELTLSSSDHVIAPADFATIYDVPSSLNGYGWTIGIVGRSRTDLADFQNFRAKTGGSFSLPTEVIPTAFGGVDPGPALTSPPGSSVSTGDQGEATLDVLRAGSVAPSSNILLVVATQASGGIGADAQYLVQTSPLPAQVMTISFGACELSEGVSEVDFWDTIFQQGAAEGISSFVSSGDSGASGCDADFSTPPAAPQANSINVICASSYVTCVGGTEFNDANASAYWSASNGSNLASALSYIPEGGWNEPLSSTSSPQVASSGGGVSSFIPTPSWQTGTGVPAARAGRYAPDIAFSASCHDSYFGCFAAGGADCVTQANGSFTFVGFCGTSAAAPGMAGVAALLDQQTKVAQGNLNPAIYATAAAAPSAFHDVTVATSGVTSCNVNTPSMCNNSIPSSTGLTGGQAGYLVTAGYDEVTGLGSLDVLNFINNFASAYLTPTVQVTPSATTISATQSLTVTIAVSGGSGKPVPTGSVNLSIGTYSSTTTLSNGIATIVIPPDSLTASIDGQYLAYIYTPDKASVGIYRTASGNGNVTVAVTYTQPTVSVTPTAPSFTTAQNVTVTVAVSGGTGNPTPTGSVSVTATGPNGFSYTTPSSTLSGGSVNVSIAAGLLKPGNLSLSSLYSPDAQGGRIYSGTAGFGSVTVTGTGKFTPTITVTPPAGVIRDTMALPIAISVNGGSGNPTATGTVIMSTDGYSSPASSLAGGSSSIVIPAGTLTVGLHTLTVFYTPDSASASTYSNTSGSTSINNVQTVLIAPLVQVQSATSGITTAQPLSVMVIVNGVTGTVTLTSGSYMSATATLANNIATIVIPAGTLPVGTDTITATYTPDSASSAIYGSASGSESVTISAPPPPSFNLSGTSVSVAPGASTANTSTVTLTPSNGFTGSVTLAASITNGPTFPQYPPTFSFGSTSPLSITGTTAETATLTIGTTAATTSSLVYPRHPGVPWYAAPGATLACLLLIGIPARRRSWRSILAMLMFLIALTAGVAACGGGGSGSSSSGGGGGGGGIVGTSAGVYTITVTGTSGSTIETGTFTLIVQ